MKRLVNSGASILALCGALLFCSVALADPATDVKAVYAAWDTAFNDRDAKRVAALYTHDAVLISPSHTIIKGSGAVEDFFRSLFDVGVSSHNIQLVEVVASNADMIAAVAKWSASFNDGTSADVTVAHVFQKQPDGTLKLKLQTFN
jgi:uncharacterized protein (TIGR02246 family)